MVCQKFGPIVFPPGFLGMGRDPVSKIQNLEKREAWSLMKRAVHIK
jgi:hypothetical protein